MINKICSFLAFLIIIFSAINYFTRDTLAKEMNSIQKSDEVVVISNPKNPAPKDGLKKRIVFEEELSIGVAEGDENYMFGEVIVFNTDKEGNFYVTDWESRRIQKYDTDGKYLLTIGREGQGPGEFGNLSEARFDKDGNIYVTDIAHRRISFFDTDGKYLKQTKIPDVFENLYMNSRGYFISSCSKLTDDESGMGWQIIYGLFDGQFKIVSEFHTRIFNYKAPEGRDLTSMAKFTATILNGMAFQPRPIHIVADNDCIYFGYPEVYSIDIYSPDGIKIKNIRRDYNPIKVGEKDKEYFVSTTVERFNRDRGEEYKNEVIKFIKYPKHKPAYLGFTLMEGRWLVVIVEFIEGEYTLFDLFDEEGTYIGNFKANIPSFSLFFKNGKAYAVATEDDYKFVKRYNFEIQEFRNNKWVKKR
jgi:hypothetical protein